jgi:hypothetical protein
MYIIQGDYIVGREGSDEKFKDHFFSVRFSGTTRRMRRQGSQEFNTQTGYTTRTPVTQRANTLGKI